MKDLLLENLAINETLTRILSSSNVIPVARINNFNSDYAYIHCNIDIEVVNKTKSKTTNMTELLKVDITYKNRLYLTADNGYVHLHLFSLTPLSILNKYNNIVDGMNQLFNIYKDIDIQLDILPSNTTYYTLTIVVPIININDCMELLGQSLLCLYLPSFNTLCSLAMSNKLTIKDTLEYSLSVTDRLFIYPTTTNTNNTSLTAFIAVICLYSESFSESILTKTLLNSISTTKKQNKKTSAGPSVDAYHYTNISYDHTQYTTNFPLSLPSCYKRKGNTEDTYYSFMHFTFSKLHIDTIAKQKNVLHRLITFKQYISYHISCLKSQLHYTMRQTVTSNVKQINRSKTSVTGTSRLQI